MANVVSYTDSDGRKHWTADGSRAHRDHLAAKPDGAAQPVEVPQEPKGKPVKDVKPA